jgi:trans-aconitate methyltransferase
MTLQSIYNKAKGKSTIGIVKDILEEACRDAGLDFLPTNEDLLEHMESMDDCEKTLVVQMSEKIKQNIYDDIQSKLANNNENIEPRFPDHNAARIDMMSNFSKESQLDEDIGKLKYELDLLKLKLIY